ncbi:MAG: OmpA family protein [Lysobacter sp.]|nr:OmpA family protein [Lysobacter sp.]
MFNSLIRDAAERFNLGDKAERFIGLLLGLIFDPAQGGFSGLRSRFTQAGLGDLFRSWIGAHVVDNVLQPDQFSAAVGDEALASMAAKLGVPKVSISLAGATLLPKLIGLLTRDGEPSTAPAEVLALINGAPAPRAHHVAPTSARKAERRPGWLLWLVPLLLLLAGFVLMRSCRKDDATAPAPTPAMTAPSEPAASAAPVAQANARFDLSNVDGKVTVNGQVASDADKLKLWDALKAAFGEANLGGDIRVDPATLPAGWMDKLIGLLPQLKASGLKFGFDGDTLSIDTSGLPEDQRIAVSEQLRKAFGGFQISGLWDRAAAALSGLKPGFSGDDLVGALNLMNVYFDSGSATITRDSLETLDHAAKAIKAAPAGIRIEVGGHTDNTGDAAANLTLSQQRADAVIARLAELGVARDGLVGKGYGQDQPIADNASEEGKAKNRRMHFTVLK